jgi:RHS repeat-associated protein
MAAQVTGGPDTVVVLESDRYTSTSSTQWTLFDVDFDIDDYDAMRRHEFRITNGDPNGSHRITQLSLTLTGTPVLNTYDVTGSVAYLVKLAKPLESNSLSIALKGPVGNHVDIDMVSMPDPAYAVAGPTQLTLSSTTTVGEIFDGEFTMADTASGPYVLSLTNGAANGSQRVTSAAVYLNGNLVVQGSECGLGTASLWRQVSLDTLNEYTVVLKGNEGAYVTLRFDATDITAPALLVTLPVADTSYVDSSGIWVRGSVADETPGTVRVDTLPAHTTAAPTTSFADSLTLPADGVYRITVMAVNSAGFTTEVVRTVIRDTQAPVLDVAQQSPDTTEDATYTISGTWSDSTWTTVTVDDDTVATGCAGSFSQDDYELDYGANRIIVRAVDAVGNRRQVMLVVSRQDLDEAADPADLPSQRASALSAVSSTPFYEGVEFLFQGANPLQEDVEVDSIRPTAAAVIRGTVMQRDFGSLPNATVSVLDHPEYGFTATRADGSFDLVVNGGAQLVLRFNKEGYLEAQRQVVPPLNDYVMLDSLALVGRTVRNTDVNLQGWHTAKGRFASDGNGDRDLRLIFPAGTVASVAVPNGPPATFGERLTVRAKEFTVGGDGPAAMPALLPRTSAYTYCVHLSADQADSVAAAHGDATPEVQFSKPVVSYVQNFLNLPVGTRVPVGYYDPKAGVWKASQDGIILKILDFAGDTAVVATASETAADDTTRLDSLGITAQERIQLKAQFKKGATLWRVALPHFSTVDFNFNQAASTAALSASAGRAGQPLGLVEGPCTTTGSIVECENRVLGERIPIVGTPFSLNYRSHRAPGDVAVRTVRVPVLGTARPPDLLGATVILDVAGRRLSRYLSSPDSGDVEEMVWDGLDAYGRPVQGSVNARLSIGYKYRIVYAAGAGRSFNNPSAGSYSVAASDREGGAYRTTWNRRMISLGAASTGSDGLGGWTISPHHLFDVNGQGAVYFGDGSVLLGENLRPTTSLYAGNGTLDLRDTDRPATECSVAPARVTVGPDQRLYIADNYRGAILRVDADGTLRRIAGGTTPGLYTGDGPALTRSLKWLRGLAVASDGSVYFSMAEDWQMAHNRVCRLSADGSTVTTVIAGSSCCSWGGGDGDSVKRAWVYMPGALALGPDGDLFLADHWNCGSGSGSWRVRRISPDGIITTYAGSGACSAPPNDDTGIATSIGLSTVYGLATDADGNLYIAEGSNHRVRKVAPDGLLTTDAHREGEEESLFVPVDVAVAPDGALYITSHAGTDYYQRVWRRDPDGALVTIAGGGGAAGYGAPAAAANLGGVTALAVAADGSYFVVNGNRVTRIARMLGTAGSGELVLPSRDASEVYYFNEIGQHLRTKDAMTGALRYLFNYDVAGRLKSIYDGNGDSTLIVRGTNGQPVRIVAPYGQATELSVDEHGYLHSVTNPAGETVTLVHDETGLLQKFVNARADTTSFTYGTDGRLDLDEDAAGGWQRLEASHAGLSRTVERTTREGTATTYTVTDLYDGTRQRAVVGPDGLLSYLSDSTDAQRHAWSPVRALALDSLGPDPRFGLVAPVGAKSVVQLLPQGQTRTMHASRQASGFAPVSAWEEDLEVNGRQYQTAYDPILRRYATTTPESRQWTLALDAQGRAAAMFVPGYAELQAGYDTRGRLESFSEGSREWVLTYDDSGRVHTMTDPLTITTTLRYDPADRVIRAELPGGRVLGFGHDEDGNLEQLTTPRGATHGFEYNPVGQVSAYVPPVVPGVPAPRTDYTYDYDRQLTLVERPDGVDVTLGYETGVGRLTTITQPRGTIALYYNAATGLVDSITNSADTVSVQYAYTGPLPIREEWTGRVAGWVETDYDDDFRPSGQRVNGGQAVTFAYDDDGLLAQAGSLGVSRSPTSGFVTGTQLGAVNSAQSYDGFGALADLGYVFAGDTLFRQQVLQRDDLGRIAGLREVGVGTEVLYGYRYDAAGRLYAVTMNGDTTARYWYDANGNRTWAWFGDDSTVTGWCDAQDRLDSLWVVGQDTSRVTYAYTAAGELQQRVAGTDTTRYTYDALGNLLQVVPPAGDTIRYLVDGRTRRVGRQVNGAWTHRWLYGNQLNVVAELAGDSVVARYVYGTRGHVPDYVVKGDSTYRLVTDQLGSVRAVVNVATGTVAERTDYDVWGNVTLDTSPGFVCLGFAGGLRDEATELVRFGARDYDPGVGRWTCKDPIGFAGGDENLYAYADGDPVGLIDPSGTLLGGALNAGEAYGERAAMYWAELSINPNRNALEQYTAVVLGLAATLWMPCTSDWTFLALTSAYGLSGWAAKHGPWMGKLAYHEAHGAAHGGRAHLQLMLRIGRSTTWHRRLLLPWK